MTVKVKKDITGQYLKAMDTLGQKAVKIGLLASAGSENIRKGIINEFGAVIIFKPDGKPMIVPERSFIRSTFEDEKQNVTKRFEQIVEGINKGDFAIHRKLKAIGIEHEGKVKKKITDIKTPPNSQRTVKYKGFDNPLIHTGEMRSKVSSAVINKNV
jgi:hypothetical protein